MICVRFAIGWDDDPKHLASEIQEFARNQLEGSKPPRGA
jgi:hypothetical protein